jgi:uronate dehydrogenase
MLPSGFRTVIYWTGTPAIAEELVAVEIVAITGATGRIGAELRRLLARPGRILRLIDVAKPEDLDLDQEEFVAIDVEDDGSMRQALTNVTGLVHLAGFPSERPWPDILGTNIDGTYVALEAARACGVSNVFLASSIHAVGACSLREVAASTEPNPRPDSLYGVSKAAMEALGSVYATRCDMSIVSARICHFHAKPGSGRNRQLWLSPADLARLVEVTLALQDPGHHVVWAVSANGRPWLRPEAGLAIGFEALDNSNEPGATPEQSLAANGITDGHLLGGEFLEEHPLGQAS